MNIIIPLGGKGKRFSEYGYTQPKPLIKVLGKEILFWVIDSLKVNEYDKIFIPYNEELDYYNFENHISLHLLFKNLLEKVTCLDSFSYNIIR